MVLSELIKAARDGIPEAQYILGILCENGLGKIGEQSDARKWYADAAEKEFPPAQYSLARLFLSNTEDGDSFKKGVELLRRSAEAGFSIAQFDLALLLEAERVVCKNDSESLHWLTMAADGGYPEAAAHLAFHYSKGTNGLDLSMEKAFLWYLKAAQWGDAEAAVSVGRIFQSGLGTEKNEAKALDWFRIAQRGNAKSGRTAVAELYLTGSDQIRNPRAAREELLRLKKEIST